MIRPATLADARWVADLERRCFGADAWTFDQVVEELTGPGRRAWVAEGTAYVVTRAAGDHPDEPVDLQRIAVDPAERRRGLAGQLLAVARPDRRMLLEVSEANAGARALYAGAGFVEIARRRRYYADGADALVLALDPPS